MAHPNPFLLLAGPTACGKSALALSLADALGGCIVNADSMQVYKGLGCLTAQPSLAEQRQVPHFLYGTVAPQERYSVARWRQDCLDVLAEATQPMILVGGTGLYFEALLKGLSQIPNVPQAVRADLAQAPQEALFSELWQVDPTTASTLAAKDRQRTQRALGVFRHTGTPLSVWHQQHQAEPLPYTFKKIVILPERAWLYQRINQRFEQMLAQGALDEVKALLALGLDPSLPAMKAVGVPELQAYLAGDLSLEEATAQAQQASRRYAKRQFTWFRNRYPADLVLAAGDGVEEVLGWLGK